MCDCMERSGSKRWAYMDMECIESKNKDGGPHNSKDCFNVQSKAPIVQSSVNGVKVCAALAEGMAFRDI